MDLPGLGIKSALVVPVKESKKSGVSNASSAFLRVLPQSQVLYWTAAPTASPLHSSLSELPSLPSSPTTSNTAPATTTTQHPTTEATVDDIVSRETTARGPESSAIDRKCKQPDSPELRYENIRIKARDETYKAAASMSNYYNKTKCTIDDDYSGGDKIKFYQIITAAGIVRNKFCSGDFKQFSGDINPDVTKEVSLHEAALKVNAANRFTVSRCHCKGKCENAQCSCIRSKIKCSTHCHPGNKICCNVSEDSSINNKTHLNQKDITILTSPTGWLTDKHMSAANQILQRDHPLADGLQDTLLQQNLAWQQPTSQYV